MVLRFKAVDTTLSADDQVLLAKSEDDLQYSVHNLNKTAFQFSMEINAEKTRVMAFRGMEPIRSKICIYIYIKANVCVSVCSRLTL
jgi:hypothetical protein